MAPAAETTTHSGTSAFAPRLPLAMSASVMTPIVFWASLVPWASETIEAEADLAVAEPPRRDARIGSRR
jgi:hypothetical protein